ncbi:hypothetical protein [Halarcobacter sp.]|uniref:hypothetical protein n=1 Tax=Halarcobacter sp. TaxID=2321133 RepID=UPI003A90A359
MHLRIIFILLFFSILSYANSEFKSDILILHSSTDGKVKASNVQYLKKITKIANSIGVSVKFQGVPWQRALLMLKVNKADGVINASYKENRALYAVYPKTSLGTLDNQRKLNEGKSYYIYKNKDSTISWDGKVFKNPDGPIGVETNFAVIEDLNKHKNIEIKQMESKVALLRELYSKKLSSYAAVGKDIDELLEKYPAFKKKIVKEKNPIRQKNYFLVFSKQFYNQNKEIAEKIWNGLKE